MEEPTAYEANTPTRENIDLIAKIKVLESKNQKYRDSFYEYCGVISYLVARIQKLERAIQENQEGCKSVDIFYGDLDLKKKSK